uniref:PAS domain-containing protein n=1 Tax=Ditylenchus dipsaci TaxID=166011 RepID=A0A915CUT1_9BILA
MYASKRRQRNFKRVRESNKQSVNLPSNPSKRHRERLNGELETVASYCPMKMPFYNGLTNCRCCVWPSPSYTSKPIFRLATIPTWSVVPSLIDPPTGVPLIDANEPFFSSLAQKALGGFVIILSENAEIYYVTENIETYLGFLQSDVLHQPLFEMIHSEDREDLKQSLRFEAVQTSLADGTDHETSRSVVARFRCLLDNTCGFIRVEIKGRFMALHSSSLPTSSAYVPPNHQSKPQKYALVAICTPFVPPIQLDPSMDDPILKTKHSLDLSLISMDTRFRILLELEESGRSCEPSTSSKNPSIYSFIHPADVSYASEAHDAVIKYSSSGLMIYRLIGRLSGTVHYMQSSLRLFFKNGKPETIGGNHRLLTEVDGYALLEKRASLKFKYISFDDTLLQSHASFKGSHYLRQQLVSPLKLLIFHWLKAIHPLHSIQRTERQKIQAGKQKRVEITESRFA